MLVQVRPGKAPSPLDQLVAPLTEAEFLAVLRESRVTHLRGANDHYAPWLGWELVGSKTEDGSFFLYLYGASDPLALVDKLAPFDAALGFYDDDDPEWAEYATLRDLLDQAKAMPPLVELKPSVTQRVKRAKRKAKKHAKRTKRRAKANAKPKPRTRRR